MKSLLIRPLPAEKTLSSTSKIAEESCKIVSKPGFYPARLVTVDYLETYTPILAYQLALAGYRLAQVLNSLK